MALQASRRLRGCCRQGIPKSPMSRLQLLLAHNANVDLQDHFGHTALAGAALYGRKACVRALLHAGADTELRNHGGKSQHVGSKGPSLGQRSSPNQP